MRRHATSDGAASFWHAAPPPWRSVVLHPLLLPVWLRAVSALQSPASFEAFGFFGDEAAFVNLTRLEANRAAAAKLQLSRPLPPGGARKLGEPGKEAQEKEEKEQVGEDEEGGVESPVRAAAEPAFGAAAAKVRAPAAEAPAAAPATVVEVKALLAGVTAAAGEALAAVKAAAARAAEAPATKASVAAFPAAPALAETQSLRVVAPEAEAAAAVPGLAVAENPLARGAAAAAAALPVEGEERQELGPCPPSASAATAAAAAAAATLAAEEKAPLSLLPPPPPVAIAKLAEDANFVELSLIEDVLSMDTGETPIEGSNYWVTCWHRRMHSCGGGCCCNEGCAFDPVAGICDGSC